MSDPVPYVLSSAAWLVAGSIIAAVWMRVFYHRILVREGKAAKEPPLSVFVAIIVGLMAIISALYSASTSLSQHRQGDRLAATAKTAATAAAKAKTLAAENHRLTLRNQALANCINNALGERQQVSDTPANNDAIDALKVWAGDVLGLFDLPKHPTPAQQAAEVQQLKEQTAAFEQALSAASATLHANARYRDNHPLGKC
jgi:hypothetical protein